MTFGHQMHNPWKWIFKVVLRQNVGAEKLVHLLCEHEVTSASGSSAHEQACSPMVSEKGRTLDRKVPGTC